ncbi:hypothetical protein BDW02DRAFT_398814 [Decorospora gaudefroyi]|uniref:Uncharacterized protein n=1 Tax=Decorospora gaudefroyi TaxID=184978 RepID=A0A6A5K905_9PLEO|nr:hypothetical protein BDW02DRAFT_398814 [Decorospora gaudefroyi]
MLRRRTSSRPLAVGTGVGEGRGLAITAGRAMGVHSRKNGGLRTCQREQKVSRSPGGGRRWRLDHTCGVCGEKHGLCASTGSSFAARQRRSFFRVSRAGHLGTCWNFNTPPALHSIKYGPRSRTPSKTGLLFTWPDRAAMRDGCAALPALGWAVGSGQWAPQVASLINERKPPEAH